MVCLCCGPVTESVGFEIPRLEFEPRRYVCTRATGPVTVDGKFDEQAWELAARTSDFLDIEGPGRPTPVHRTSVRMLWDDNYFYVAAQMEEPHVWGTLKQRDSVIYHDNDFEVFIDPDGDNHLYYELEINTLGTEWDLMLVRPYRDGGPAINAWDIQGLRTAVHVDGTLNDPSDQDEGWSVEIAIPWSVLAQAAGRPSPPAFGDIWRVNFSRVHWRTRAVEGRYEKLTDPATGEPLPEFNWVWSPQGLIAMHYPEMWGEVEFAPEAFTDFDSASTEHGAITAAASLMPVYYLQKQWFEDHGSFASTLDELDVPAASLPAWNPEPGVCTTVPLPVNWSLSLETCGNGFTARLDTPYGTATVNQDGRLERMP
ncbi:MAG: carbohydrate-binding family 9-like protein [Candidatus Krumholzibacteriota bacterium]